MHSFDAFRHLWGVEPGEEVAKGLKSAPAVCKKDLVMKTLRCSFASAGWVVQPNDIINIAGFPTKC